jgi:two-component system LytT family response regulator
MLKAIIIDDEPASLRGLEKMITTFTEGVTVVATAASATEGLRAIKTNHPDVVFLDIEMPQKDGFELLKSLDTINFEVVFTTAHDQYAIRAFHTSALDYLLKPIDPEELRNAIQKVKNKKGHYDGAGVKAYIDNISGQREKQQIGLASSNGTSFVHLDNIIYLRGDGAYTYFFLKTGQKITVSKNLKEYERLLGDKGFYRIHKSYMVNLQEMKKYSKGSAKLIMSNGDVVDVSKRRKDGFITELAEL